MKAQFPIFLALSAASAAALAADYVPCERTCCSYNDPNYGEACRCVTAATCSSTGTTQLSCYDSGYQVCCVMVVSKRSSAPSNETEPEQAALLAIEAVMGGEAEATEVAD
ncbi:hypothetical protein QBC37DRAFT_405093 [Rhypophila decipiens]|uniref:Extracellular membrane protein CFEM domain-containing protein n=1 Tax=Rhypophila decipiens TaxID=261697 RepID=A0AAN6Y1Z2_9PEZI|nr:hypothetical protein QBC37DRAFT_405093 [Rhypophila decipiens]